MTDEEQQPETTEENSVDTGEKPDTVEPTVPADPYDIVEPEDDYDDLSEGSDDEGDPDEEEPESTDAEETEDDTETEEEEEPQEESEPPAESAEPADPVEVETPATDAELTEVLEALKIDPDIYEPDLVKAFDSVRQFVEKQSQREKVLRDELAEVKTVVTKEKAESEAQAWFDEFDSTLDKLDLEPLGKGHRSTLGEDHFAKRKEVLEEMSVLSAGLKASGKKDLPLDKLIEKAVRSLGIEAKKAPKAAPSKPMKPVNRPGRHAGSDNLTTEERAIRNLRAKMQEYASSEGDETFD